MTCVKCPVCIRTCIQPVNIDNHIEVHRGSRLCINQMDLRVGYYVVIVWNCQDRTHFVTMNDLECIPLTGESGDTVEALAKLGYLIGRAELQYRTHTLYHTHTTYVFRYTHGGHG
jgi:hypothetical protein